MIWEKWTVCNTRIQFIEFLIHQGVMTVLLMHLEFEALQSLADDYSCSNIFEVICSVTVMVPPIVKEWVFDPNPQDADFSFNP